MNSLLACVVVSLSLYQLSSAASATVSYSIDLSSGISGVLSFVDGILCQDIIKNIGVPGVTGILSGFLSLLPTSSLLCLSSFTAYVDALVNGLVQAGAVVLVGGTISLAASLVGVAGATITGLLGAVGGILGGLGLGGLLGGLSAAVTGILQAVVKILGSITGGLVFGLIGGITATVDATLVAALNAVLGLVGQVGGILQCAASQCLG